MSFFSRFISSKRDTKKNESASEPKSSRSDPSKKEKEKGTPSINSVEPKKSQSDSVNTRTWLSIFNGIQDWWRAESLCSQFSQNRTYTSYLQSRNPSLYDHSVAILPLLAKADHMLTDGFLVKKEGLHELPPDLLHKSVLVGVDRKPVQLYWQPFSVYLRNQMEGARNILSLAQLCQVAVAFVGSVGVSERFPFLLLEDYGMGSRSRPPPVLILHLEEKDDSDSLSTVLSLKSLCRAAIRNRIGLTDAEVNSLAVPQELKDFLLYASSSLRKEVQDAILHHRATSDADEPALQLYYQRLACTRGCNARGRHASLSTLADTQSGVLRPVVLELVRVVKPIVRPTPLRWMYTGDAMSEWNDREEKEKQHEKQLPQDAHSIAKRKHLKDLFSSMKYSELIAEISAKPKLAMMELDGSGSTLLHHAAEKGTSIELLENLLSAAQNKNVNLTNVHRKTPIALTVKVEVARKLLEAGATISQDVLLTATYNFNRDLLKLYAPLRSQAERDEAAAWLRRSHWSQGSRKPEGYEELLRILGQPPGSLDQIF